jgi:hypothetical protein
MQEFINALMSGSNGLHWWYKIYANDLVLIVHHSELEMALKQLRVTSIEFGLALNESKSAIFAVKRHTKLGKEQSIDGFPIVKEYTYLGVLIDDRGSIEPHLAWLRQRAGYLRLNLSHFTRKLAFKNQFLLWLIYIRPYFLYVAPVVHTQSNTTQRSFHTQWRCSLKSFLHFPRNLPSPILD